MSKETVRIPEALARWLRANVWGAVIVAAVLVWLFLMDPAAGRFALPCPFHSWTGLYCPGCGGQRAVHALLHGRVLEAAGLNLLLAGAGMVAGLGAVAWAAVPAWRARLWPPAPWLWGALVVVCVLFGVLRNVPVPPFSWLAP